MARLFKTPVTVEGTISTNNVIASTQSSGDEGGQIDLTKAATNTTLTTGVTLDVFQNRLRIFETGGTNRGYYLDISAGGTSAATNIIGTASAVSNTVTGTNSADLVYGNMADNDQFRIRVGGTATNAGFVEIATADDGTEPIYVRQYTGVFTTIARTATLLDGSGNTSFPGTVTGTTFAGSGASLTNVPAANVTGTLTSTVLGNSAVFIGTTSVALNRTTADLALTGISSVTLPGSTSGTAQIIPTAAAGTGTVITLPATTGTVITTGDSATVTNTMLAGSIANAKLANTAVSLGGQTLTLGAAATTTISGMTSVSSSTLTSTVATGTAPFTVSSTTLVTNLNADLLDGLNSSSANAASTIVARDSAGNFTANVITATTFSGSGSALTNVPAANVTGTLTSTVLGNSTVYIGNTAVALNRTIGNQALTGISSITLPGSTSGTAQIIPTAVAGTGTVITLPATTGTVALTANKLSVFAATTSSELLGVISDETGSGALVFGTTPTITPAAAVAATSATTAGYMGLPQNAKTASYTLVAADAGKHIYFSGSTASQTLTIPANSSVAFEIGTTITFINLATVSVSIAITTNTMYLAGPGTTGTRTLAAYGMATAVKLTSTTWIISGNGLT